jgi:hypothetical protein
MYAHMSLFHLAELRLQMYEDAVQGIHDHLVQKSIHSGLTYTAELIPERSSADTGGGEV